MANEFLHENKNNKSPFHLENLEKIKKSLAKIRKYLEKIKYINEMNKTDYENLLLKFSLYEFSTNIKDENLKKFLKLIIAPH